MKQNSMLAMILAGGRGSRLHDLTNKVAKPAVSYFRLVRKQTPDSTYIAEQPTRFPRTLIL